eukprot:TRINITY_DN1553_c0_g1_i3.p1 TRINITY_DN1553_c0_g1~~TRINITY_DN1553_c0_g1_i3.p1  ORF type:complete len:247 (+),score=43.20 TRINITY_DN1553_c0_g1_i3:66-806(+)
MKVGQQRFSELIALVLFVVLKVSRASDGPPSNCNITSFSISNVEAELKAVSLKTLDKTLQWVATVQAEAECGKWHYKLKNNREYKMDAEEVTNIDTQGYERKHWQVELYRGTRYQSWTSGDFTTGFIWQVSEGESFGEKCSSDNSDSHGATWSEKGKPVDAKVCYYFDSPIKICKSNNLISGKLKGRLSMRLIAHKTRVDSEGVDVLDTSKFYECSGEEITFASSAYRAVHAGVAIVVFTMAFFLW